MKKLVLITLFMTLAFNVISQETKNDTIVVNGDKVEILINNNKVKIVDSPNGLKINVFSMTENGEAERNPYYESRYENDVNSVTEKKNVTINIPIKPTFIKDDKYVTDDKGTKMKFRSFDPIYPTIYYAYSAMTHPITKNDWGVPSLKANSFEWGSYIVQFDICHNKRKSFGLTTALGISNTYNHFSNSILGTSREITNGAMELTYLYHIITYDIPMPDGVENHTMAILNGELEDSFLRYWSLRLPISVQFQWRLGYNKMAFSFGPEFEWRFAMKSFIEYDGNKYLVSDKLAYNPFGVNALAVLSFRDFVIFGRTGLTYLFNQKRSPEYVLPVNIGIGLTF